MKNLDLSHEESFENKGYDSDYTDRHQKRVFFRILNQELDTKVCLQPVHSLVHIPMSFLEATSSELSLEEREVLIQAIEREPVLSKFIANKYKTQEICEKAVSVKGWILWYIPDQHKTQKMCSKATEEDPWSLQYIPDQYKMQ